MAGKIYIAKQSAVVFLESGDRVTLRGGVTRVREGHPLLEGRESMFEEIDVHYDVETARQAPKAEAKPEPKAEPKAEAKAAPAEAKAEAVPAKTASAPRRGPRKT